MLLLKIFKRIVFPNTYNEKRYKAYLRKKGVLVGDNTAIYSPNHVYIDTRKPWLINIGDYCSITSGVHILAHDYSRSIIRKKYGEFIGGSLPVTIGNNVFIGINAIILKGTYIGSNSIVAAGAVVSGHFDDGVVIGGNPARIICTTEEYYNKCKQKWIVDAIECARAIKKNSGEMPTIENMSDGYAWLYLPHTEKTIKEYPLWFKFTADDSEQIKKDFLNSEPMFSSFDEFLEGVEFEENS